jgi:hypothetical protein
LGSLQTPQSDQFGLLTSKGIGRENRAHALSVMHNMNELKLRNDINSVLADFEESGDLVLVTPLPDVISNRILAIVETHLFDSIDFEDLLSKSLNINIGQGIESVKFNMTPLEVQAKFGNKYRGEEWMGGNLNDSLLYGDMILTFNECNSAGPLPSSKLVFIKTNASSQILLQGKALSEITRDELLSKSLLGQFGEIDDNLHVEFDRLGIKFNFDLDGKLNEFYVWAPKVHNKTLEECPQKDVGWTIASLWPFS